MPKDIAPATYTLEDRYAATEGRVFLTGTQALVRLLLDQARRDRDAGLNTGGFVSGYRGSPLGAFDLEMWRAQRHLADARIRFMPAINEDLGATAVLGSQQASLDPDCEHEGIFGLWYGKGPGVDRSGDALRHGNAYGSAPKGGVLVVAGDDHGCVSSSMPHQSDVAFMTWFMPTLNPADVGEYLDFGAYGYALSRYSGTWVGFKAVSETVESGRSVELRPDRRFSYPDFELPPGGLHVRAADLPSAAIEERIASKLDAVRAFVGANPIDRVIYGVENPVFGFVTTGKGHLDLMEALRLLGVDEATCRRLGIDIYKVGMVWPLYREHALDFVRGKREVLVIEEKRGIIESQFKEYFYDWPGSKPEKMVGKYDSEGNPLIPWTGELSPRLLIPIVAERLHRFFPDLDLPARAAKLVAKEPPKLQIPGATRTPYFCSGCPHNTSTRVPDGSKAASGIGCHVMASWMNRETVGFAQMGGEGVPWIAQSMFNGGKHIFQNLGEGTWYHSGSLAIRQAVAAGTNITFKVLFNDAVAMTGGQPVDGPIAPNAIARAARAEGVERIAVVSDAINKFADSDFPSGTTFHDRSEMDALQRELREVPGVSVLVYEQMCATEKRRRRKRGKMPKVDRFVEINEAVCEGCGDCSKASNCLSVEPLETPLGRKRRINQATCNADYSCLGGFCPSFVTVEGAVRKSAPAEPLDIAALARDLPDPDLPDTTEPFDLLVTGVGGTGVVTVGALISMAAHLEGKGVSVLDFTGFAQKFGTVLSYLRIGADPEAVHQVRIDKAAADAVIGGDVVVSSAPQASAHYRAGTQVVLNMAEMPTGDLVLNRDAQLSVDTRRRAVEGVVGAENVAPFDAGRAATRWMGDPVFSNVILLGFAWARGLVPVGLGALRQAIVLNGTAVEANHRAFDLGRVLAAKPELLDQIEEKPESLDAAIARRVEVLTAYQDADYARAYEERLRRALKVLPEPLHRDAAQALFRVMHIKDEYEVARLQRDPAFRARIGAAFEGGSLRYHFAPPFLPSGRDWRGRPKKRAFGPWVEPLLDLMARGKRLRGGALDLFGKSAERRAERRFRDLYCAWLDRVAEGAEADEGLLRLPIEVRGYGPVKEDALNAAIERLAAAR